MTRKTLPSVLNAEGQPLQVTLEVAGGNEGQIVDPVGMLTDSRGGHTSESQAAMSEFIRKCKNGEIEMKSLSSYSNITSKRSH